MEEYIISIRNVKKNFGKHVVFENLDLNISRGECIGIMGENGTGKSTLFRMIIGVNNADAGAIFVNQKKVGAKGDFPQNIGVLIDTPKYWENMTGLEYLNFLAKINKKVQTEKIIEIMKKIGLDYENNTLIKDYSTGMRKKIGIVQAIMENQEIILLDEAFDSLDDLSKRKLLVMLYELRESKKTILLIEHTVEEIKDICDKIYVIKDKTLIRTK